RAQLRLGQYDEAVAGFQAVLRLDADHTEATQSLLKIESFAARDEQPGVGPSAMDADKAGADLFDGAKKLFKAGELEESEAKFLESIAAGGDEGNCRLNLARIYNQQQDWPKALEQWLWLRGRDSTQLEPQLQVARAKLRLGQHDGAIGGF